jgi:hypothetical protein
MSPEVTPRGRRVAFAVVAALVAALALSRWAAKNAPPGTLPVVAAPSPRATAALGDSVGPAREPHAAQSVAPATEPSRRAQSTPAVFDFAQMTPPANVQRNEEDRFRTNDRFTKDDLLHPERYFDAAARMPELNRPEERRDVLAYFLAYREKLGRDLAVVGEDAQKREEILVVIERYDAAIRRLRKLVDGAEPK